MLPDQGRDQTDLSRLSKSAEFDPLRDIYAFLGKVGADLTYIAWLSEELKLGDTCFELLKCEMTIPGFKLSRTDPWDKICRRFPPSTLTTFESQIEPAVEARNLFSTGFRLELPPSAFELSRKLPEKLQLDLPLGFKTAISEKWSCDTLFSFLETVQEIHYRDAATGCPPDRWGTFFILAICTHLREVKGKQFQLRAIRLLKKLRGEDPGSNSMTRQTRRQGSTS